ncbi:MAG: lasso RiPP family leader peptide-containing protein [Gemmatimonadaceae bacterium]
MLFAIFTATRAVTSGHVVRCTCTRRCPLYEKPRVVRFGTFRELTQTGNSGPSDGAAIHGDGCVRIIPRDPNARCS